MTSPMNYAAVGATRPSEETWGERPSGFRRYERTLVVGRGAERWVTVTDELLNWGVKARSGFTVTPASGETSGVRDGAGYILTARLGPISIREQCES